MEKIIIWSMLTIGVLAQTKGLTHSCLSCHKVQQIPNNLIYRRYLLKYSSYTRIEEEMFAYLREPHKSNSIMPPEFFLKFPMKKASNLDDTTLKREIKNYIQIFDVKQKLKVHK